MVQFRRVLWSAALLTLSAGTYVVLAPSVAQAAAPPAPGTPAPALSAPAGAGHDPLALTFGAPDAARGAELSQGCAGCHGARGVSTKSDIPGLAGQIPRYTQFQLAAFRAKLRPSEVMQRVASRLSDQDIADLSAYFAAQPVGPAWKVTSAVSREAGQKLFMQGDPARNLIACQICHGENGRGLNANGIASVTNLSPGYAVEVLHEFRDAPGFGGLIEPEAMRIAVHPLTDADIVDLAAYLSSMK